jgi:hypothetical protein
VFDGPALQIFAEFLFRAFRWAIVQLCSKQKLSNSVTFMCIFTIFSHIMVIARGQSFPPIVSGLVAYYTADSWDSSSNRWIDLSGAGNHVTEVGGATAISVMKGQGGAPSYVYGASTAWMKFPVGILPSAAYTLLHVARYNGNTKGHIFFGVNTAYFLSGFYFGRSGVCYHSHNCGSITQTSNDVHGSNWVVSADRSDSYRSNGVDRTVDKNNNCAAYDRLAINAGYAAYDSSDFAVQTVLVYNRKLVDADIISLLTQFFTIGECSAVFPPDQRQGEPCTKDVGQCLTGLVCATGPGGATCAPPIATGGDCTPAMANVGCAPTDVCSPASLKCITRVAEGGAREPGGAHEGEQGAAGEVGGSGHRRSRGLRGVRGVG